MLIPHLQCPAQVSHWSILRMKQWIRPCLGTQGGIKGGWGRQDKKDDLSHRRALWGPLQSINQGFPEGYLELMAFEVVRERGKESSKGRQKENTILDTTKRLESNGIVLGKSIHWIMAGAWVCQEVQGDEFKKPGYLELQAKQFELHVVGNEDGME